MKDIVEKPLVSIWCTAYNHAPYIRDAIDGFLAQRTTFPYEIMIHDDCSTDGTTDILKEYEEKYPDIIRVIYEKENIYRHKNYQQIIEQIFKRELTGKYVAFCEGDDYWVDSEKLQRQVDYLERNEDCVMVAHNTKIFDCRNGETREFNSNFKTGDVTVEQIMYQTDVVLHTSSLVIRKELMFMKGFFNECGVGDYPLKLYAITKGRVHYLEKVMSVYRYMHSNSWSQETQGDEKNYIIHCVRMIDFLEKYNEYTDQKHEKEVIIQINRYCSNLLLKYENKSITDIISMCEIIDKQTDKKYHKILENIKNIFERTYSIHVGLQQIKKFCQEKNNFIVWGTGKISGIYSEELEKLGIEIQEYVVSQKKDKSTQFRKKKILEVHELKYEKKDFTVIVLVKPIFWADILERLYEHNITNFFCLAFYEI